MTQHLKVVHFNPDNPKHVLLKDAMHSIQQKQNKATLSTWISIYSAMKSARIDGQCTAAEILLQSYYEGLSLLESGGTIENPIAWLRSACYQRIQRLRQD